MDQHTQQLSGKVALVTGAARGIGQAISLQLAAMGAQVVLVARDRNRLQQVAATITQAGGQALAAPTDLTSEQAIEQLARQVRSQCGRLDILVNNAGVGHIGKPLHQMEPAHWDETFATNLRAIFLLQRAFVPLLTAAAPQAHIINISSLAGRNPLPNGAAYAASKWALNGLTYSVAEELRPLGIRVSVVAPGSVHTGFGGVDEEDPARAARKIQPEDLAHVVAMLVTQAPQSFVSEVLVRPTQKP